MGPAPDPCTFVFLLVMPKAAYADINTIQELGSIQDAKN